MRKDKKSVKALHKEYIVFGLGRFGSSVARQLELNGCEVLAIDIEASNVQKIADEVTYALTGDITNTDTLAELGIRNFDGAIVAMASSMEASVLAIIWAKEQGVPFIMAKAYNDLQAKIFKKVGADAIIFPESEMGVHIANNLAFGSFFDTVEITDEYSIIDLEVPKEWVGKTLIELNLRKRYGINVIGFKGANGEMNMVPEADKPIKEATELVIMGRNDMLKKLKQGI